MKIKFRAHLQKWHEQNRTPYEIEIPDYDIGVMIASGEELITEIENWIYSNVSDADLFANPLAKEKGHALGQNWDSNLEIDIEEKAEDIKNNWLAINRDTQINNIMSEEPVYDLSKCLEPNGAAGGFNLSKCVVCGSGEGLDRDEANLDYKQEIGYETWTCCNPKCGKSFSINFSIKDTNIEILED